MARRRMISQEMIYDAAFNALSIEAQLLFVRMLAVADDCGVVPADPYELTTLTNPSPKMRKGLMGYVKEIKGAGLMTAFEYSGKPFVMFKRESFDTHQSYLLNKRTRSEYLKMSYDDFVALSKNFQELPRDSKGIIPLKQKVESREQKVEEKEIYGEFKNVTLSAGEFQKLLAKMDTTERAFAVVEILSAYKESKGKTYKSDYAAMQTWAIGELEKREKNGKSNGTGGTRGGREVFTNETIERLVRRTSEPSGK
jgi:hypothetical protein